jgi:methionyl-tRNA formyltransferase
MQPSLDLVFAGSSEFAVPSLERLAADGHRIIAVLTQPPRPAGRRRKLTATPVQEAAEKLGLRVSTPPSLRDVTVQRTLSAGSPDALVVVDYGLMLPEAVLAIPRLGCINGHASLLPRWRGAAPIERAILAGDKRAGVCVMAMERGLDTGPVFLRKAVDIDEEETAGDLRVRLSKLCAAALSEALPGIASGELAAVPQDDEGAVYAAKLTTDEARLDWRRPAFELARQVRAFNPRPGSFTELGDQRLKILEASAEGDGLQGEPGTVIRAGPEGIDVATGDGIVRIRRLQMPGRRPVTAREFLNATDPVGWILGQTGDPAGP